MTHDNLLMVADSERNADMLYASRMMASEPFIYLRLRGRCHLVVNDLEAARVRKSAPHCRVLVLGRYCQRLKLAGHPDAPANLARVIREILREQGLKKLFVPAGFPYGLARALRRMRVKIKLLDGPFFPQRAVKTADEIKKISAALIMAEVGLAEGLQVLKHSKAGRGQKLSYRGGPLTADRLRAIMNTAIYQAGGLPINTIVAGGRQACDPHERGHGVLRAGEPIVLDVFPRSQKTGYFGDITRTVVKGRASEAVRRLHHTVTFAQQVAFGHLTQGEPARQTHEAVAAYFRDQGYPTRGKNGECEGFFHATGHGVGLELHEAPRISAHSTDMLARNQVVTIEPGLYYHELGGMRMEDVVMITANGMKNLTRSEKHLEV
jgi:Xaa-Pro aminopeptidase